MLNEGKDNDDCSDNSSSEYSMVSASNVVSNMDDEGTDNESKALSDNSSVGNGHYEIKGALILDGEDEEEVRVYEKEESSKYDGKALSALLSIPDTVFLPSEMRSVGVASGVTHEQGKKNTIGSKFDSSVDYIIGEWNRFLAFCTSCLRACHYTGSFKAKTFKTSQVLPLLVMFATLISVASWRSHMWKSEVLRLSEDLRMQKSLIPLTISLLKEREALLKKQKLLEEEIERVKKMNDQQGSDHHDIFSPDKSDDGAILSVKNCYVEASLSLGQCTKDWQQWFSYTADDGSAQHGSTEETVDSKPSSYDDGFADDMSKLVKGFTNSLTSTTKQSYSFIEKSVKDLSYDGIKDAFSGEDYIQRIIQSAHNMGSKNDTGD